MGLSQENRLVVKLMQPLTILGFHLHWVLAGHLWVFLEVFWEGGREKTEKQAAEELYMCSRMGASSSEKEESNEVTLQKVKVITFW